MSLLHPFLLLLTYSSFLVMTSREMTLLLSYTISSFQPVREYERNEEWISYEVIPISKWLFPPPLTPPPHFHSSHTPLINSILIRPVVFFFLAHYSISPYFPLISCKNLSYPHTVSYGIPYPRCSPLLPPRQLQYPNYRLILPLSPRVDQAPQPRLSEARQRMSWAPSRSPHPLRRVRTGSATMGVDQGGSPRQWGEIVIADAVCPACMRTFPITSTVR